MVPDRLDDWLPTPGRSVLGGVLVAEGNLPPEVESVDPEDFGDQRDFQIWLAIDEIRGRGGVADIASVHRQLAAHGVIVPGAYLVGLTEICTPANLPTHIRELKAESTVRRADERVQSIKAAANRGDMEELEDLVRSPPPSTVVPPCLRDLAAGALNRIEDRMRNPQISMGRPTGWPEVDDVLGGWRRKELVIVGARPSMGKTAWILQTARSFAEQAPVYIASLEMSTAQMVDRLIAQESGVPLNRVQGKLFDGDLPRIANALQRLHRLPIYIEDHTRVTAKEVRRSASHVRGIGMVVIDHIGYMRHGGGRERHDLDVGDTTKDLKALAKDFDCSVAVLSQLSRKVEQRTDKRPMLSDLRDSGAIEEDADAVVFLYRDEYYDRNSKDKGVAEIDIAKNRNGPTGMVQLGWDAKATRFKGAVVRA